MYRQTEIHSEHRDYLRIWWRFNSDSPIEKYRLGIVTYSTSCASYQILRTLQHLVKIEEHNYPIAADVFMHDMFVDDIITGVNSDENVLVHQN